MSRMISIRNFSSTLFGASYEIYDNCFTAISNVRFLFADKGVDFLISRWFCGNFVLNSVGDDLFGHVLGVIYMDKFWEWFPGSW